MYAQEQKVVYGIHGVCTIVDIEEKIIDRQTVQFYVLAPISQPGSKYYVPVHNAVAVSKMRLPMEREMILSMVNRLELDVSCWIDNENQRKLRYRELISNCDPQSLFSMVRLLRAHRQEQYSLGRKFHVCDANFLKDAENLLADEFAFVLGIGKIDALNLI